jgi:curli biogenesis system outer membrane secretion channel CsgG
MRTAKPISWALATVLVASCTIPGPTLRLAPDEEAMVSGSRVRTNTTILTDTFLCYDNVLHNAGKPALKIAVGNIADYSGKMSDTEGAVITRGGSLMLFSALGLMKKSVRLQDRFDTSVTDLEMGYINSRQLGDGKEHQVEAETVPWMPYFGGSIQKSDYVILGGITEVNFNLASGGFSAEVNQIGAQRRRFSMSIAADLRLVKTDSLEVKATSSFQKQFTGYEVSANLFSFFDVFNDKQLFDVYGGNIAQEPMQLGVRTILEEATLQLLSEVNEIDYLPCSVPKPPEVKPAPTAPVTLTAPAKGTMAAPAKTAPAAPAPAIKAGSARLMIGLFSLEANAAAAVKLVSEIGITATVEALDRGGRTVWHVFADVTRDENVLAKVQHLGFPDAYYSTR